jgi:hypothetical protein
MWKAKAKAVAEEYSDPTRPGLGAGSYFYDNYHGPNYYVAEQQRLKNVVESNKDHGHPNFSKAHLQNLIMQSVMNKMDQEDE